MKISNVSKYILWVLFVVSFVFVILFFAGEKESVQLTTGACSEVSTQLDSFLYWLYVVIGLGAILLPVSVLVDAIMAKRWSLLIVIASVVVLYFVCKLASSEVEFSRVVNGETQVFTESTMQMIDGWLWSIYALVFATVALIIGFGLKRAILK